MITLKKILFLLLLGFLLSEEIGYSLVASGFKKPIFIAGHPTDPTQLFVVEQRGLIWSISNGIKLDEAFINIKNRVYQPIFPGDERGLLGFAMPLKFNQNKYIYLNYINKDKQTTISRYNVQSKREEILIQFKQPYSNHNGGMMTFGPDGYLYISVGDGGSAGDPHNNAQNLNNLFGSILRIDVDVESGYIIPYNNPFKNSDDIRSEIWVYGLRNPWRFSFDSETGDLYIGDVGQNSWEEVNFQSSYSNGGENYGWNHFEGFDNFENKSIINNIVEPIHVYPNNANIYKVILGWDEKDVYGCSITGGYVYNGEQIETLKGHYLFADYCTGRIWSFKYEDNKILDYKELTESINLEGGDETIYISSFGEDALGNIYIVNYNGSIYQIQKK